MRRPTDKKELHRIGNLQALDELVGKYIVHERPQITWQDAEGFFSFETEEEAREALLDPYYRHFLPRGESAGGEIRRIEYYRSYAGDLEATWELVEKLAPLRGAVQIARRGADWEVAFGRFRPAISRHIGIAICLAALHAEGLQFALDVLDEDQVGSCGPFKRPEQD